MTLIELIVYIGLVAIIIFGSVFSSYSIMLSQEKAQAGWQSLSQQLYE